MRDQEEVKEIALNARDASFQLSKYPGMSYEEGVSAALEWVLDKTLPNPLEDEC